MLESKLVWIGGAMLIALLEGWQALEGKMPTQYQLIAIGIAALAQGFVAWRAFVQKPPA